MRNPFKAPKKSPYGIEYLVPQPPKKTINEKARALLQRVFVPGAAKRALLNPSTTTLPEPRNPHPIYISAWNYRPKASIPIETTVIPDDMSDWDSLLTDSPHVESFSISNGSIRSAAEYDDVFGFSSSVIFFDDRSLNLVGPDPDHSVVLLHSYTLG